MMITCKSLRITIDQNNSATFKIDGDITFPVWQLEIFQDFNGVLFASWLDTFNYRVVFNKTHTVYCDSLGINKKISDYMGGI